MTVRDLIEILEEMNPDAEVRFAQQPNYPFEYSIDGEVIQSEDTERVYLAEREQVGYLPGEISEQLGWRQLWEQQATATSYRYLTIQKSKM